MRNKAKYYSIGWLFVVLAMILAFLCSCTPENIKPCLNGVFISDGIELVFDNGNLTGQTKCNILNGTYETSGNYINFNFKSTKVFCINEYKTVYFRNVNNYFLTDKELTLTGNDFEIVLFNIK